MKMQKNDPIIERLISLLEAGTNLPANLRADPSDLHSF